VVLTSPLSRRLPPPGGPENGAASVGDDVPAGVNRAAARAVEHWIGQLAIEVPSPQSSTNCSPCLQDQPGIMGRVF
jgi:hypothetical protein